MTREPSRQRGEAGTGGDGHKGKSDDEWEMLEERQSETARVGEQADLAGSVMADDGEDGWEEARKAA